MRGGVSAKSASSFGTLSRRPSSLSAAMTRQSVTMGLRRTKLMWSCSSLMPVSRPRAWSLAGEMLDGGWGGAAKVSGEVTVWLKAEVSMAERLSKKEGWRDEMISGDDI